MQNAVLLVTAFGLLVLQTTLATFVQLGPLMPNVVLPMVIYLGMAPDVSRFRGALLAFLLGLMQDSMCGNAMGFWTFVSVATFLVARGTGWRVIMRGRFAQVVATATGAVVAGGTIVALRRIFREDPPFEATRASAVAIAVIVPGLTTGAIGPWIFQMMRRIETFRRRDEGSALV
jgi:rod shape-determining protein MreD